MGPQRMQAGRLLDRSTVHEPCLTAWENRCDEENRAARIAHEEEYKRTDLPY